MTKIGKVYYFSKIVSGGISWTLCPAGKLFFDWELDHPALLPHLYIQMSIIWYLLFSRQRCRLFSAVTEPCGQGHLLWRQRQYSWDSSALKQPNVTIYLCLPTAVPLQLLPTHLLSMWLLPSPALSILILSPTCGVGFLLLASSEPLGQSLC
jgi:hypothetical protein